MARHHRRKHEVDAVRSARLLLLGLFVLLRISDAAIYYLSFQSVYPVPGLRGNVIVSVLWTTVFLVVLCFRRIWARYVLIVYTGYVALISCVAVFMMFLVENIQIWPSIGIAGWFVAYFATAMTLFLSRDISRLANRM